MDKNQENKIPKKSKNFKFSGFKKTNSPGEKLLGENISKKLFQENKKNPDLTKKETPKQKKRITQKKKKNRKNNCGCDIFKKKIFKKK